MHAYQVWNSEPKTKDGNHLHHLLNPHVKKKREKDDERVVQIKPVLEFYLKRRAAFKLNAAPKKMKKMTKNQFTQYGKVCSI